MIFLVQLMQSVPGHRETRNALQRTAAEIEFPTAEIAISYLAAPWRTVAANSGRAIAFDNRPINDGGGITILATRKNGKPLVRR